MRRAWIALPVVFLLGLVVALPLIALTETQAEKDLKEALGFDLENCGPPPNLASPWLEGPDLSSAIDELRAVTLDGDIYLVGGTTGIEELAPDLYRLESTDALTRFDPRTQSYEELTPLPRELNHVGLATYRGEIYVVGGFARRNDINTSSTFFRYDPERDSWSRLPDLPEPRAAMGVGVIGHTLVVAGGSENAARRPDTFGFDFRSGRWSRLADMHSRRGHIGAAVVNGKLYVAGGRSDSSLAVDWLERFDLGRNEWRTLPSMPIPAGGLMALAVGDDLIAIAGGDDGAGTVTGAVQEFVPGRDQWRLLPALRTARHGHAAALADGEIWVFGGSDCAYFEATDSVEHIPVRTLRGSG